MRFATLISLTAICALALAACRSPVSSSKDSNGSVVVAVTVPARAESSYPAALREALSEEGRYIHPDTRSVEAVISGTGISEPISARADLADGETSAVVHFTSVPAGSGRILTVSLYDAGGALLARGTASLDIEGGERTEVDIAAVPLTATTVAPGPYETGVRGTEIDGDDAGATRIIQFDLPKAGAYVVYFTDYDSPDLPVLYGPDGRRVTTQQATAYTKSFTAAVPGSYYVALDVPAEYSFEANLTIDADTTVTASGPTLYVDPTLTVMDRQREFTLTVACGYVPGTPQADFGSAEGTGKNTIATNGTTITVQPGANGLAPYGSAPFGCYLDFTDALLGIPRENSTAVYFTLHAAPRTVVYLGGTGVKPADSTASASTGLGAAAGIVDNEAGTPVIAVRDGYSTVDPAVITFDDPALVLGGCDGASWTRSSAHGTSTVNLISSTSTPSLQTTLTADQAVFDGLKFLCVGCSAALPHATIVIGARATLRDCEIRFRNTTVNATGTSVDYAYLRLDSQIELDRCSVVGEDVNLITVGNAVSIRAVEVTVDSPVSIVNCLISPGAITASAAGVSFSNGLYTAVNGAVLNLAGSTISAGSGNTAQQRFNSLYSLNPATLNVSNCLLLSDNTNGTTANYALYTPTGSTTTVRNSLLAYSLDPLSTTIALVAGVMCTGSFWQSDIPTANLFSLLGGLSLGSTNPTSPDYLKPSGSSALTTGGVALTSAVAGFTPSGGEGAFLVDRLGNPRTAPWTIGAYEY